MITVEISRETSHRLLARCHSPIDEVGARKQTVRRSGSLEKVKFINHVVIELRHGHIELNSRLIALYRLQRVDYAWKRDRIILGVEWAGANDNEATANADNVMNRNMSDELILPTEQDGSVKCSPSAP